MMGLGIIEKGDAPDCFSLNTILLTPTKWLRDA
jgi:hypothetical protein